ncbi:hypothetical protein GGS24DRAFT_475056 [Hypoxylon argillaceum]|nr:hypothetical protein GGS24DRAFT_475056 [Hypoxylon argillaceum]
MQAEQSPVPLRGDRPASFIPYKHLLRPLSSPPLRSPPKVRPYQGTLPQNPATIMCPSDPSDMVCGRPLALVATRIWFSPKCKIKKSAWLASTKAQMQSVRTWLVDQLLLQMYGPGRSDEYRRIVATKVGNSLYSELSQLVKEGVVGAKMARNGYEIVWPDWTEAWSQPDWNGNKSEEASRAVMETTRIPRPMTPSPESGRPAARVFERLRQLADQKGRINSDLASCEHETRSSEASVWSELGCQDATVPGVCSTLVASIIGSGLYERMLEMESQRDQLDTQMLQALKEI